MTQRSRLPIRGMLLAGVLLVSVLGLAAPAVAQYERPEPPVVEGEIIQQTDPGPADVVQPGRAVQPAPGQLALTGANLTLFVALGMGAVGAGVLIFRAARRRSEV